MQGMPGWMKWTISLLIGFGIIVVGFRFAGWLLTTFFIMNCLVLIIVVLLQSGKAADLARAARPPSVLAARQLSFLRRPPGALSCLWFARWRWSFASIRWEAPAAPCWKSFQSLRRRRLCLCLRSRLRNQTRLR